MFGDKFFEIAWKKNRTSSKKVWCFSSARCGHMAATETLARTGALAAEVAQERGYQLETDFRGAEEENQKGIMWALAEAEAGPAEEEALAVGSVVGSAAGIWTLIAAVIVVAVCVAKLVLIMRKESAEMADVEVARAAVEMETEAPQREDSETHS